MLSFRAEEIMSLKSDRHPCVTLALIASMPRVFEAVQDKCITKANCKKDSKQFYVRKTMAYESFKCSYIDVSFQIKYSFSCLQCPLVQKNGTAGTIKPTPLPALNVRALAVYWLVIYLFIYSCFGQYFYVFYNITIGDGHSRPS